MLKVIELRELECSGRLFRKESIWGRRTQRHSNNICEAGDWIEKTGRLNLPALMPYCEMKESKEILLSD